MSLPEMVMLGRALGSLASFFVQRFDRQVKLYDRDESKFRDETINQLQMMAEDNSTLKTYVKAATDGIQHLIQLRNLVVDVEYAENMDEIKRFFEEYCQSMLLLRDLKIEYPVVSRNFGIRTNYIDKLGIQLFDYFSDMALMGIHVLESSEDLLLDADGSLDFDSIACMTSLAYAIEEFLLEAENHATSRDDDYSDDHLHYVSKIAYYFDNRFSLILTYMGHVSLQRGLCGYAAFCYDYAKKSEERLERSETDSQLLEFHTNNKILLEMLVYKAMSFAWLEQFHSELNRLITALSPKDAKGKVIAFFKDTFSEPGLYSVDGIRKSAKEEMKTIDSVCEEFGISLDYSTEGLELPDLAQFRNNVALPRVNFRPGPLK
ncbi:MAG: hypothetical protein ACFFFC_08640 [Candidatus Thorarchaeota archaeon]